MSEVNERIKIARKERGLTQQQLADLLNVSYVMISQYENGKRNPKASTILKIANALDVNSQWLSGSDDVNMDTYEADLSHIETIPYSWIVDATMQLNVKEKLIKDITREICKQYEKSKKPIMVSYPRFLVLIKGVSAFYFSNLMEYRDNHGIKDDTSRDPANPNDLIDLYKNTFPENKDKHLYLFHVMILLFEKLDTSEAERFYQLLSIIYKKEMDEISSNYKMPSKFVELVDTFEEEHLSIADDILK